MSRYAPYILTEVTAAAVDPVDLCDVKDEAQIDTDDDDSQFLRLIRAVTINLQETWDRQFIQATYDMELRRFPGSTGAISIPRPPLSSVTSITYTDTAGNSQTLSSSLYTVETGSDKTRGYITPAYAQYWPATYGDDRDVTVRFVCGYGTAPEDVPADIRQTIASYVRAAFDDCDVNMVGKALAFANRDVEFV